MPTLDQIQSQIAALPHAKQVDAKKEIKELPSILHPDEKIENAVRCFYNSGKALAVATNKRLVLVDKGLFSMKVEDFPYDKISSVEFEGGLLTRKVKVFVTGNKAEFDFAEKSIATMFSEFLRMKISAPKAPSQTIESRSVAEELKNFKDLLDSGTITQEEFDAQKKKLLSQ